MNLKIYCINLKERPDRWERFWKQPGVQRLVEVYPFQRWEAVNGKLINIQADERVSVRTKRNILMQKRRDHEDLDSPGGVGCYLSHKGVWDDFLSSGKSAALIFEDDALVPYDFLERFQQGIQDLQLFGEKKPGYWVLSRLYGKGISDSLDFAPVLYKGKWATDTYGFCTGYLLFPEAAQALSKNAFPIDGHVDFYIRRCAQLGMFQTCHYKDLVLDQVALKRNDSNIQEKSCKICDLPSDPRKKGYWVLSSREVTVFFLSVLAVSGLAYIKRRG